MRNKLFLAFFIVIAIALVSNLIFERLILRDFEEYARGAREDQLYWVLASVEGSYTEDGWDEFLLKNSLHWAIMLGFDAEVRDSAGNTVLTSKEALQSLSPAMKRRMESLVHPDKPEGEFEEYPLYVGGNEIGSLLVRPLSREGLQQQKEAIFKKRGRTFLLTSFLIAGSGALFLSFVFSLFLTGPIRRLKRAAEAVAAGDLSVRVKTGSKDEIGKLTETFNHMVEALEREENLRRHLTSNIAHELRTPLTVIRANLEAVADGVESTEEGLKNITAEVDKLITLVDGIEDVTKAEASFFTPAEYVKVGIRSLIEGIAQSMRPIFRDKGLELTVLKEGDIEVVTDVDKLERILRNIISNSLRHTEKGGVWIDYGKGKKEFFIEIRDSGSGMSEEELSMIFKRFYKGKGSEGAGLGLSIVKELVDVMEGKIEVESAPGKGTVFRLTFPLKK
jgi:two-component system sensor histidine kinase BaeS